MFDLHPESIAGITDKRTFVEFVKAMRRDFLTKPEEWKNGTIDAYFDAVSAWLEDAPQPSDIKETDWAALAKILYMGKLYE